MFTCIPSYIIVTNKPNVAGYAYCFMCMHCVLSILVTIIKESINQSWAETKWTPFADDIFNCIFLNENVWIPIEISLKFVPKGPINNILALVQIMVWRRPGGKSLSEPMMVSLPTHICVTRPQWVKHLNILPMLLTHGLKLPHIYVWQAT